MMDWNIPGRGWANLNATNNFKMEPDTLIISLTLHKLSRMKLIHLWKLENETRGIILISGGKQTNKYDTDGEPLFMYEINITITNDINI